MTEEKYLLTTRPAVKVSPSIRGPCFTVLNTPLTEIVDIDTSSVRESLERFRPNVFVITSEIASEKILEMYQFTRDSSIICIGDRSAEPLRVAGLHPAVPHQMNSAGIVELLTTMQHKGMRVALCRSSEHSKVIDSYLEDEEIDFISIDLYGIRKIKNPIIIERMKDQNCIGILVTSSLEARSLVDLLEENASEDLLAQRLVFCMGTPTRDTLTELGVKTEPLDSESSIKSIVQEIAEKHCNSGEWI